MRISALLLASMLGIAALSGCKSPLRECNESNEDYAGAREMPPLQSPPGLDAPDTRNALRVPPLNTPERVRGKDEPCLSAPPPYSTTSPVEAPKPASSK
jgi:uncharacterized lipoprotein